MREATRRASARGLRSEALAPAWRAPKHRGRWHKRFGRSRIRAISERCIEPGSRYHQPTLGLSLSLSLCLARAGRQWTLVQSRTAVALLKPFLRFFRQNADCVLAMKPRRAREPIVDRIGPVPVGLPSSLSCRSRQVAPTALICFRSADAIEVQAVVMHRNRPLQAAPRHRAPVGISPLLVEIRLNSDATFW